jgi:hypothetical protein
MHMFELFEFESGLSSLEKIKRKAIRNLEKKGKPILAQLIPVQPSGAARAPTPSVVSSPAALFPPPSAQSGQPVGAVPRLIAALSLSAPWDHPVNVAPHSPMHSLADPRPSPVRIVPSPATALPTACARAVKPRPLSPGPTHVARALGEDPMHPLQLTPASFRASSLSLMLCPRRRPTPTMPATQPTGSCAKPPRAKT